MNITNLELQVVKAFIKASMDACGDFSLYCEGGIRGGNKSRSNEKDISKATGLTQYEVTGILRSLEDKRLIEDSGESFKGEKWNDYYACPTTCSHFPEIVEYINLCKITTSVREGKYYSLNAFY